MTHGTEYCRWSLTISLQKKKKHKKAFAYDHDDKKGKRHRGPVHAQIPVDVANISVSLQAHSSGPGLQMLARPSLGSRAGLSRL